MNIENKTHPLTSGQNSLINKYVNTDLALLNKASNYRDWLFSLIEPYLGQRLLEIGAGIGNHTRKLLGRELILATDSEREYVDLLAEKFQKTPEVKVRQLDLANIEKDSQEFILRQRIDTAIIMNVLEHVEFDLQALADLKDCLTEKGKIVLIVPAVKALFSKLDLAYGHYRRYNRADLLHLAGEAGLDVEQCRYFNFAGLFGWWASIMLTRRRSLPEKQTLLFDRLVPFLKFCEERIISPPIGLSVLCVFSKR